jgi:hypothetical protein
MLAIAYMPFTEIAWNMTERPPTTLKGEVVSWLMFLSGAAFAAGLVLQEYWLSENRPPIGPATKVPPEDPCRSDLRALMGAREQRLHGQYRCAQNNIARLKV